MREEETTLPCYIDGGYFVPIPGGVVDPEDEADVPGGAPVIIEDFFKSELWNAGQQSSQSPSTSEELGIWSVTHHLTKFLYPDCCSIQNSAIAYNSAAAFSFYHLPLHKSCISIKGKTPERMQPSLQFSIMPSNWVYH